MLVSKQDFARLLAATVKVVESRSTIPILSTVRLVASGGKLTATATDLDIEAQASVDVDGSLEVCVDAHLIESVVKKAAGDAIQLEHKNGVLTVKAGRYTTRLQTLPVDDYPSFSADGFTATFDVDLAALVAPVKFAISTEETRYYLNGVYLHVMDGRLVAVATDGHRLARHKGAENGAGWEGVILPRKFVGLISSGLVTVSLSTTKVRVSAGNVVLTSKLIDGTFPDYNRVIPTGNDRLITFNSPDMKLAADRVSVISSERGRAIRMAFADNLASLSVSNPDSGSANEEVVVSYDGEPIEIGFNSAYLAELIGQFPVGDIQLALADPGSPSVFTSPTAPELLAVLMPMRV